MLVKGGSNDVGMNVPIMDEEKRKEMVGDLVSYFEVNFEHHSRYSLKFLFCEILNLINIIGQIFFIDSFLGGNFWMTICIKLDVGAPLLF